MRQGQSFSQKEVSYFQIPGRDQLYRLAGHRPLETDQRKCHPQEPDRLLRRLPKGPEKVGRPAFGPFKQKLAKRQFFKLIFNYQTIPAFLELKLN